MAATIAKFVVTIHTCRITSDMIAMIAMIAIHFYAASGQFMINFDLGEIA